MSNKEDEKEERKGISISISDDLHRQLTVLGSVTTRPSMQTQAPRSDLPGGDWNVWTKMHLEDR